MEKVAEINKRLLDLWRTQFKDDDDVALPLFYPPLERDADILFIGLNPS